jgi:hypothetical protein
VGRGNPLSGIFTRANWAFNASLRFSAASGLIARAADYWRRKERKEKRKREKRKEKKKEKIEKRRKK